MSTTPDPTPSNNPTLLELVEAAEEVGFPLDSCRKFLDLFCGSSIEGPEHRSHLAEAIIALIEKAELRRARLEGHLHRLATEGNHGSQDQQ